MTSNSSNTQTCNLVVINDESYEFANFDKAITYHVAETVKSLRGIRKEHMNGNVVYLAQRRKLYEEAVGLAGMIASLKKPHDHLTTLSFVDFQPTVGQLLKIPFTQDCEVLYFTTGADGLLHRARSVIQAEQQAHTADDEANDLAAALNMVSDAISAGEMTAVSSTVSTVGDVSSDTVALVASVFGTGRADSTFGQGSSIPQRSDDEDLDSEHVTWCTIGLNDLSRIMGERSAELGPVDPSIVDAMEIAIQKANSEPKLQNPLSAILPWTITPNMTYSDLVANVGRMVRRMLSRTGATVLISWPTMHFLGIYGEFYGEQSESYLALLESVSKNFRPSNPFLGDDAETWDKARDFWTSRMMALVEIIISEAITAPETSKTVSAASQTSSDMYVPVAFDSISDHVARWKNGEDFGFGLWAGCPIDLGPTFGILLQCSPVLSPIDPRIVTAMKVARKIVARLHWGAEDVSDELKLEYQNALFAALNIRELDGATIDECRYAVTAFVEKIQAVIVPPKKITPDMTLSELLEDSVRTIHRMLSHAGFQADLSWPARHFLEIYREFYGDLTATDGDFLTRLKDSSKDAAAKTWSELFERYSVDAETREKALDFWASRMTAFVEMMVSGAASASVVDAGPWAASTAIDSIPDLVARWEDGEDFGFGPRVEYGVNFADLFGIMLRNSTVSVPVDPRVVTAMKVARKIVAQLHWGAEDASDELKLEFQNALTALLNVRDPTVIVTVKVANTFVRRIQTKIIPPVKIVPGVTFGDLVEDTVRAAYSMLSRVGPRTVCATWAADHFQSLYMEFHDDSTLTTEYFHALLRDSSRNVAIQTWGAMFDLHNTDVETREKVLDFWASRMTAFEEMMTSDAVDARF